MDRNKKQELILALKTINNICNNNPDCKTCILYSNDSEVFNCNLLRYHPLNFDKIINKVKDK